MAFGSPNLGLPTLARDQGIGSATPRAAGSGAGPQMVVEPVAVPAFSTSDKGRSGLSLSLGGTETTTPGSTHLSRTPTGAARYFGGVQDTSWTTGSGRIRQDASPSPVPSAVTTSVVGWPPSRHMDSPKRPTEEWERQIETLDQKEMEIHQTQLRLIREQTATFRGDLLALRQEVADLKATFAKHMGLRGEFGAKVEARLQELTDHIGSHAQLHQEVDQRLGQFTGDLQGHHRALQNHAPMKERMEYLEKFIGDSAEQHQRQVEEVNGKAEQAHAKLEQLYGRFSQYEAGHSEFRRSHADREAQTSTLAERVAFLEKLTGDSAEKHVHDISTLRSAHEWQGKDYQARAGSAEQAHASLQARLNMVEAAIGQSSDRNLQAHSTVAERLAYLEKCVGDSAEKHQAELSGVRSNVERMGEHANQIDILKQGHIDFHKNLSTFTAHTNSQEDRIKYIEKVLGDSVEQHKREIEDVKAAHGRLQGESSRHAQNHGAATDKIDAIFKNHSSIEERIAYVERAIGDSVDKAAKEVSSLKAAHGTHTASVRDVMGKHVALQDRMEYLEKAIGDSAEKHTNTAALQQAKLDQLHGKVNEQDRERQKHIGELTNTKDKLTQSHATIEERLAYIEKAVGESFERHALELDNLKGAHKGLHTESRDQKAKHATTEERVEYIESWLRAFKAPVLPSQNGSASLRGM